MNLDLILDELFKLVVIPALTALTIYAIYLISTKINMAKAGAKSELQVKYLSMLDKTITECVIATTQTYVDTLKKQNKFDEEAQKIALQRTYENVMRILTEDAKEFLQTAVGDFETYVYNKIEAEVKITK